MINRCDFCILANLGGHLDMFFAESLGCGPAVLLKSSQRVNIEHMILSGPEYLDFGVLNRLILKIMLQKQYKTARDKTMFSIRRGRYRLQSCAQPVPRGKGRYPASARRLGGGDSEERCLLILT